jgi:hypothetical protein
VDRAILEFEPRPGLTNPYRPDTVVDGWATGEFVVRACSLRGYAHRYRGVARQDDLALGLNASTGALALAVADGVSSAKQSHLGATVVCLSAVEFLVSAESEAEVDWQKLLNEAVVQMVEAAHTWLGTERDAAIAERLLASTLVSGLVTPQSDGSLLVTLVQAGDSSAWILSREKEYRPLVPAKTERDGLVSSKVVALPRLPDEIVPATGQVLPGEVLLVGTDGFGDALGDGQGLIGALFAERLAGPLSMVEFAHLLDFSRETFDDDRTLVAVWPKAESPFAATPGAPAGDVSQQASDAAPPDA